MRVFNILVTAVATMTQSIHGSGDYLYLPNKGLAKTWYQSHLSVLFIIYIIGIVDKSKSAAMP
ncbi:hypothetical protein THOG05_60067 [Vibrio rotiferianus]|nr:hypothetical protein THOG05_60067 [Vibrio rotiferianus]